MAEPTPSSAPLKTAEGAISVTEVELTPEQKIGLISSCKGPLPGVAAQAPANGDGFMEAVNELDGLYPATEDSSAGVLVTESVLIEGVAYTIPEPVALELLRLNIELHQAEVQAEPVETTLSSALRRLDSRNLAKWADAGMALAENLAMHVQFACSLRASQARDALRAHLFSPQPTCDGIAAPQAQPAFQQRVQPWMMTCFGAEIAADRIERNHRFLEEALELVQSCGCTANEAHQLVDYVYGRPVGEPVQEVGGVMVTLAALCLANGLDMHQAGEAELARIWTKVEAIRAKQAAKPKHSPLPQAQPAAVQAEPVGVVESSLRFTGGFHVRLAHGAMMPEPGTKLYTAPQAQPADAPNEWEEIGSLPTCDDLNWLYCQDTNTIDGPVAPHPMYEDSWTHWAYAEAPSTATIDAAMAAAQEGTQQREGQPAQAQPQKDSNQ